MRYLIDGHNLIAQLPDISLDDPHDEAKLVYKLRSFCTRTHHRVTVVFDGGLPGGVSTSLSTSKVTAKFASSERMTADQVLSNMMRKIKNASGYTLVSNDQEVIAVAKKRGIAVMRLHQFMAQLAATPPPEKADNPQLTDDEVEEWLNIFSDDSDYSH